MAIYAAALKLTHRPTFGFYSIKDRNWIISFAFESHNREKNTLYLCINRSFQGNPKL